MMYVICGKEIMLLWLQSLQIYLAVPEMKSDNFETYGGSHKT